MSKENVLSKIIWYYIVKLYQMVLRFRWGLLKGNIEDSIYIVKEGYCEKSNCCFDFNYIIILFPI